MLLSETYYADILVDRGIDRNTLYYFSVFSPQRIGSTTARAIASATKRRTITVVEVISCPQRSTIKR